MAERLHILMPCAKPHNIPRIAPSVLQCEPHPFELRWHIMQQGPEPDRFGFLKINEALDGFKDGWFQTPSDDSLHHASLYLRTGEIIAANPSAKAIVFSEDRGREEILHAHPDNMKPGAVDGSQVIWNRAFVGDLRYEWFEYRHEADGVFTQTLYERDPGAFFFCPEVLVRFNSLEWLT